MCVQTALALRLDSGMSLDGHTDMTFWYKNNTHVEPGHTRPLDFSAVVRSVAETLARASEAAPSSRLEETSSHYPVEILPFAIWFI